MKMFSQAKVEKVKDLALKVHKSGIRNKNANKGGDGWSVRLESISDRGIKGCCEAPLLAVFHDLHLGDVECSEHP